MNIDAFFKISYGLYIISSLKENKLNGFIGNTVFQVTAEPAQLAIACNKDNYTSEFIKSSKKFSISILEQNAESELIGKFGYNSGKNKDKFDGTNYKMSENGCPIVLDNTIAFLECELVETFEVGTHYLFIGKIIDAQTIDNEKEPLTYIYYRNVKKGVAPKNAPTYVDKSKYEKNEKSSDYQIYKCSVCGHEYNSETENKTFDELDNDWTCPICGVDKSFFNKI